MNVKRYVADTMTEAMDLIREELGRDAFILSQKPLRRKGIRGLFSKPQIEVVAAYEPESARPAPPKYPSSNPLPPLKPTRVKAYTPEPGLSKEDAPKINPAERAMELLEHISQNAAGTVPGTYQPPMRPVTYTAAGVTAPPAASPLAAEAKDDGFRPLSPPEFAVTGRIVTPAAGEGGEGKLASLETKIDALSDSFQSLAGKIKNTHGEQSYSPEVAELLYSLRDNEVHEEFVHKIAREVNDIVLRQKEQAPDVMEQILRQYIGQSDPIRMKRYKRTVVMLVGPTGVGKTTTLAKLAAVYSINHHAKVGVITTDTFRIAAVEQLKTYTQIMEIPLSIVYEPAELEDALKEHEDRDLVLIDTTGRSPGDRTQEEEVSRLIRHSECDEVYLVMSSTTSFTGILNILSAYSYLKDFKIIMTKLDETPTWGAVLNTRFLSDKPLSYTTSGQNVPDDIEVADTRKIVNRLMTRDS